MSRDPYVVIRSAVVALTLGCGVDDLARDLHIGGPTTRGRATLRRYLERRGRADLWAWALDNDRRAVKRTIPYAERLALTKSRITLDGDAARILDAAGDVARIVTATGVTLTATWPTAKRVISRGGHFHTRTHQEAT